MHRSVFARGLNRVPHVIYAALADGVGFKSNHTISSARVGSPRLLTYRLHGVLHFVDGQPLGGHCSMHGPRALGVAHGNDCFAGIKQRSPSAHRKNRFRDLHAHPVNAASHHPQLTMIQTINGGVRTAPNRAPLIAMPSANASSCGATQCATMRLPFGGAASPRPISMRIIVNDPTRPKPEARNNSPAAAAAAGRNDCRVFGQARNRRQTR